MEKTLIDILLGICAGVQSSGKYDKSVLKSGGKEARAALDDYKYRNLDVDGYRMTQFKDSPIIKDEYTGKKITMKRELIKDGVTECNTDHIVPIRTNIEKYKKRAFVTTEDERKAFNKEYNLALTDASLNKSKGDKSNTEFAIEKLKVDVFDEETALAMITKEIVAEEEIEKTINETQIRNISSDAIGGAKNNLIDNSVEYAWMLVCDVVQISKGKMSKEEALNDVKSITKRVLSSSGGQLAGSYIMQKSPDGISEVLQQISEHPQIVSTLAGIATIFANNILECRKGMFNADECEDRIANDAIHFIGNITGGKLGTVAGEYLVKKMPDKLAKKLAGATVPGMGFVTKAVIEVAIKKVEAYIDAETEKSRIATDEMRTSYAEIKKYCDWLSMKSQTVNCVKFAINTLSIIDAEKTIEDSIKYYDVEGFLRGINTINNIYGNGIGYNSNDFAEFCEVWTLLAGGNVK